MGLIKSFLIPQKKDCLEGSYENSGTLGRISSFFGEGKKEVVSEIKKREAFLRKLSAKKPDFSQTYSRLQEFAYGGKR